MTNLKKDVISPPYIKYTGIFDFDGLYKMIREWVKKERYVEFQEVLYKDKIQTVLGSEVEIHWDAFKKVTEYILYRIRIEYHLWEASEIEVVKDNEKLKMTKARLQIVLKGWVEADYTGKYKTGFAKQVGDFMNKHVLNKEIEFKHIDPLTYQLYDLHTEIKKYLGMQTDVSAYKG